MFQSSDQNRAFALIQTVVQKIGNFRRGESRRLEKMNAV